MRAWWWEAAAGSVCVYRWLECVRGVGRFYPHTHTHTSHGMHSRLLIPPLSRHCPIHAIVPQGASLDVEESWYDPRDEALCLLGDVVEKRGKEALPR